MNEPISILEDNLHYEKEIIQEKTKKFIYHKNEVIEKPVGKVYIYNTHQTETYATNDVFEASKVLKEKLEALGVVVTLEERKIIDYLNQNKFDYSRCYSASRFYLNSTLEKNNDYDLIIDFHRDALDKNLSTTVINEKAHAKVMFVIGKSSSNYEQIKQNSEKMNNIIKNKYPNLTRGIFERNGAVYNQDVNKNMVLIEVGGHQNTYEEVLNTVDVLSEVIKQYLDEKI